MPQVVVVGSGVSGLTTAIVLQEGGREVEIRSRDMPLQTTSAVAAAVWYPYRAYPQELVLGWSARTFEVFEELARDQDTGVRMTEAIELWRGQAPEPWWRQAVRSIAHADPATLPAGFSDALTFTAPVAAMPRYLAYLQRRFEAAGGRVRQRELTSLAEVDDAELVVNCSGLGARELCGDGSLAPIRGQVVRVTNPGLTRFVLVDETGVADTYIVPRGDDCILGGTADADSWDTMPDPATAAAILERCIAIEPRLRDAEILEHRVGLRPGRPAVRLEREALATGATCVHNYGHGGAGMTLSWGCAEAARELVEQTLSAR